MSRTERVPLSIRLAVAKTHKYASRESGDTVEVMERPGGGFSVVVVDGQGSGAGAKRLSLIVAGRAVSLLHEGVRDGAAARAVHDYLFALRDGKVSAALDIVSVDLASGSVVFTRNSEMPMLLGRAGELTYIDESGGRIGIRRYTRPQVLQFPAEDGLLAILVTDGIIGAGSRYGARFDLKAAAERLEESIADTQSFADAILSEAMAADRGRPTDDMTVVVLQLGPGVSEQPVRRFAISIPLPN